MEGTLNPARTVFFTVACILLFCGLSEACLTINEVCPKNPEWIEIYNTCNMTINLSEWHVSDNSTDKAEEITCHTIDNCTLETSADYFLILGRNINLTNVTGEAVTYFFVDDEKIGNGINDVGFEEIKLYNATYVSSMNYSGSSNSSWSWSYCNGTWMQRPVTPGRKNACPQEEPPQPPPENVPDVSITSWSVNATEAMEGGSVLITITAGNTGDESVNASAYIYATGFPPFACGAVELEPQEEGTTSCIWKMPDAGDDVTTISLSPGLAGDGWSAGGSTILLSIIRPCSREVELSVEPIEASVRFGDRTFVKATVCRECSTTPLRLAAYLYTPRWASVDAGGEVIRIRPNETSSAIVLGTIEDGCETVYIPVTTTPDCAKDFGEGLYNGKARIYEDMTGKILDEQNFSIIISGRNKALCVKCDECEKCECNCQKTSCTGGASVSRSNNATPSETPMKKSYRYFDVDAVPVFVHAGESFSANITIKNALAARTDFTAYSYAYNASTCVSLGQAPAGWVKGWDANRKTVTLDSGGRAAVELRNIIPDNTPPGTYTFRIRTRYGDGDDREDATFALEVTGPETEPALNETGTVPDTPKDAANAENRTAAMNKTKGGASVTGMAPAAQDGRQKDVFSSFYEGIVSLLSFFKF